MTVARDVMTPKPTCVSETETVQAAAEKLTQMGIGSMPICGSDNRLKGMLTDRDIVVKVVGQGRDPHDVKAGELGQGKPVTIGADDDVSEVLQAMIDHKVRRLPVIDGHDLVGIIAVADVVRAAPEPQLGGLIEALSS